MSEGTMVGLILVLFLGVGVCGVWRGISRDRKIARQAREKLAKKPFVVALRMKDGKRTYWETRTIELLMGFGATVLDFSPENGNKLWNGQRECIPKGAMAFVGTTWEDGSVWYIDGKFLPTKTGDPEPNEPILAPFFSVHGDISKLHENLAECIQHFL